MTATRKPPFALWVQNVDPERVDAKDLWEAFARYGDMCKPREHGARAVELLPESKAAVVNFASYEHACAALRGLQGALIGRITRPGLAIAWHKRQDDPPVKQQPVPLPDPKAQKERPPFFGLWVGNVHASVVHEEEFRSAFERYGELCNLTTHSVPPINILPESSSAFVNFSRYEDANAARRGMQGKLVGGAGPLRINASDLMQEYEQQQQQQGILPLGPGPSGLGFQEGAKRLGDAQPALDGVDLTLSPASISEGGPVCELLGGEIYIYESGEVLKVLESQVAAS
jgi:RNA recognition motif-containing protein